MMPWSKWNKDVHSSDHDVAMMKSSRSLMRMPKLWALVRLQAGAVPSTVCCECDRRPRFCLGNLQTS
jgi:hypothetical protein